MKSRCLEQLLNLIFMNTFLKNNFSFTFIHHFGFHLMSNHHMTMSKKFNNFYALFKKDLYITTDIFSCERKNEIEISKISKRQ